MTIDEMMKEVDREQKRTSIDQYFTQIEQRILDLYGGESALHPFHLAEIRGSLTRAKAKALQPLEDYDGTETQRRYPQPARV